MKIRLSLQFTVVIFLITIISLFFLFKQHEYNKIVHDISVLAQSADDSAEVKLAELIKQKETIQNCVTRLTYLLILFSIGFFAFFASIIVKKLSFLNKTILNLSSLDFSSGKNNYKIDDDFNETELNLFNLSRKFDKHLNANQQIIEAFTKLKAERDEDEILKKLCELTEKIFKVKYVALSVFNEDKSVKKFFSRGMSDTDKQKIGKFPEGKGLLGYIHEVKQTLMLDDMGKHSRSYGFPTNHPPMKTLLATPLIEGGRSFGNLYISDKKDGTNFDNDDKRFFELLASFAVAAIQSNEYRMMIENRKKLLEEESGKIAAIMDKLADKDFTVRFEEVVFEDEINLKVRDNLQFMALAIKDVLKQVKDVTDNLASASTEISATAEQLATTSTEQSRQVGDITESSNQMNTAIQSNARNAMETAEKASNNQIAVKESSEEIEKTIAKVQLIAEFVNDAAIKLEQLGKTTEAISEILQAIDEIADQTNLLALNAAIEAARAGEHGRGFAVVADEVRKLAERSSKSTKEIAQIISSIQSDTNNVVDTMKKGNEQVSEIIQLAENSKSSLSQILDNTNEVVQLVNQIAAASEEQSANSAEVSENIDNISRMVDESAHAVSQIAEAATDLSKLAITLQELVSMFVLSENDKTNHKLSSKKNYLKLKN